MELPDHPVTREEYLELDAKSEEPLEYINGVVVARVTPAHYHGVICMNLLLAIGPIAGSYGCVIKYRDAKVIAKDHKTKKETHMVPDIAVTRDPDDLAGLAAHPTEGETIIYNPWLVIEVLSKETQKNDREYKRLACESIEKLTHYVLIDSRQRKMCVFERFPDGRLATPGAVDRLILPHLGDFEMSIDEVYHTTNLQQRKAVRNIGRKGCNPGF